MTTATVGSRRPRPGGGWGTATAGRRGDQGGRGGRWERGPRPGGPGSGYGRPGNDTDGRFGAGSGNQVVAPITAPANVCGSAVGNGQAGCPGGSSAGVGSGGRGGAGGNVTSGRGSVLGGNQVVAPITVPINVCGNAVAVLGGAFAGCQGGASVENGGSGGRGGAGGNVTSGRGSILGGNQVVAPITAPINVCGNAVGVLGRAAAGCRGGASVSGGGAGRCAVATSPPGRGSILGGNQVVAPITAPINICGNAVAVLGDAAAGCLGGSRVGGPSGGHEGGQWGGHSGGHEGGQWGGHEGGHNGQWGGHKGDYDGGRDGKPGRHRTSGLLSVLPAVPAAGSAADQASLPAAHGAREAGPVPASGRSRSARVPRQARHPGEQPGRGGRKRFAAGSRHGPDVLRSGR